MEDSEEYFGTVPALHWQREVVCVGVSYLVVMSPDEVVEDGSMVVCTQLHGCRILHRIFIVPVPTKAAHVY